VITADAERISHEKAQKAQDVKENSHFDTVLIFLVPFVLFCGYISLIRKWLTKS
jgi:hypothetical protein